MSVKNYSVSLVITILNEVETLPDLLQAIDDQLVQPKEVIIVDGGSTDGSTALVHQWIAAGTQQKRIFISCPGNISQGRNAGVARASYSLIAFTDAGCIPQKKWLSALVKALADSTDIVAGFYAGNPKTPFEAAVVPFVLVQPDQINPDTFLPATRSMLMRKKVWEELGGFQEHLRVSEDYVFAKQTLERGFSIQFAPQAIVLWNPRKTLVAFFKMVHDQAYFDQIGRVRRKKVDFIFYRYLLGFLIFIFTKSLFIVLIGVVVYLTWATLKHRNHMPKQGWYYLSLLQVTSDIAVMLGTIRARAS